MKKNEKTSVAFSTLIASASFMMSHVASAAMVEEPQLAPAPLAAVTTATLIVTPEMSPTVMDRTTARDDGYPVNATTPVPITPIYGGVEIHLSDGSPFKLLSGGFTVHRMSFGDVTVDYTGATFSDPASPLYRAYDSAGNDISVNGALLTSVTANKFVVSSLAINPSGLTAPGSVMSIDWFNTVTQTSSSENVSGSNTGTFTVVPEPAAFGLIACGGVVLVGFMRRRANLR